MLAVGRVLVVTPHFGAGDVVGLGTQYHSIPRGPCQQRVRLVCLSPRRALGLPVGALRAVGGTSLARVSVTGHLVAEVYLGTSEVVQVGLLLPLRVRAPDVAWGEF